MPLDIPKRVAMMFFIPDRLEPAPFCPDASGHKLADRLRGRLLRKTDLVPGLCAFIRQIREQVDVHPTDAGDQYALTSIVERFNDTLTNDLPQILGKDDTIPSDLLAEVVQPGVLALGWRAFVIAGGVDLMVT